METNKEKWMMKVLNANEGINALPLSRQLLNKLYDIPRLTSKNEKIGLSALIYLAASVLIVLGFNLFSWFSNPLVQIENSGDSLQYFNYLNHF
jgi:hypothetical protein